MDRIRKILVATDHTEHARRAQTRASMLAAELNVGHLEIMSVLATRMGFNTPATRSASVEVSNGAVVSFPGPERSAAALLRAERPAAAITSIRLGSPSAAIVARANEADADLTIVANPPKGFFGDLWARRSHIELFRLSRGPVLLVNNEPTREYQAVLVATDFSDESREAARAALMLAPKACFTFLHAFRVEDEPAMRETGVPLGVINMYRQRARESARDRLNRFIEELQPRRQLITRAIQHGLPRTVINLHARQMDADLIAVGKHGKSGFVEFFLGSLTQRLISQGRYDVLVATATASSPWDPMQAA